MNDLPTTPAGSGASPTRIPAHRPIARRGERLLVIVAHPDDESFGCGSLIAVASAAGAHVVVACATPGDLGETTMPLSSRELASVRLRELHAAAAVLGVDRVVPFTYGDSGFDGPVPAGSLCAAEPDAVVARIGELLVELDPHVVLVLDGGDGHRDHLRIRETTASAVAAYRAATTRQVTLLESCLPNSLMRQWLEEMRETRPDVAYLAIDPEVIGRPDREITHILDNSEVLEVRERAIAMHTSQSSPFDGLSTALRCAFLAFDHVVEVPA